MSSQPSSAPEANATSEGDDSEKERQQDIWLELFGLVNGLADCITVSLQAFTPSDDKAVSATTKKRLALRSIQGLQQGQASVETLLEHLKALQAASRTWQRSMMFASKSHQELMEQLESTTEELRTTSERLRAVEAQRLAAVRDAETLRARAAQQEALIQELQSSLKAREEELETSQFTMHEVQADASRTRQGVEQLRETAAQAEERAAAAAAALGEARAEAAKAQGLAERHQQVVAKLTADNLVFLMQLKKAEADLAAANQERAQLRLAAERQRGPWFDQVRAGVEERVRLAMQRSEELEAQLERRGAEHASELQAMEARRQQLEEELGAARAHADGLQARLDAALEASEQSDARRDAADAAAGELRHRVEDLSAENRVLQDSVRSMRQECTERWVSEQAAVGRVSGLEERIGQLERALEQQAARVAALQQQLDVQAGVNRQLMARKAEVEWQLMAAMAKLDGGATDGPVPLNLQVSGVLHVGGKDTHTSEAESANAGARPAAPWPVAAHAIAAATALPACQPHAAHEPGPQPPPSTANGHSGHGGTNAGVGPTPSADATAGVFSPAGQQRAASPAGTDEPGSASTGAAKQPYGHQMLPQQAPGTHHRHRGAADAALPGAHSRAAEQQVEGEEAGLPPHLLHSEPTLAWPPLPAEEPAATHRAGGRGLVAPPVPGTGARGGAPQQGPTSASALLLAVGAGDDAPRGFSSARGGTPVLESFGLGMGAASVVTEPPSGLDTGGSELPARESFPVAASTAVSSPPSSVVVSSEPGSPAEDVPRVSLPAAAAARAAAVSIRTGPSFPYGAQRPTGAAVPIPHRGLAQAEGRARVQDAAGAAAGGAEPIVRRGSLHEGGDVWLADAASSASSDSSDFLFGPGRAAPVHHGDEPGGGRGDSRPPGPHQAQLHQLQQQLQALVESAGPPPGQPLGGDTGSAQQRRQAVGAVPPPAAQEAQAAVAPPPTRSDDDEVYTRPSLLPASGSGRPAIVMRTAPSRPLVRAPAGPGGAHPPPFGTLGGDALEREDPAAGIFSILKRGGVLSAAYAAAGNSPVHPALAGGAARHGGASPRSAPSDSPSQPPAGASLTSRSAASTCAVQSGADGDATRSGAGPLPSGDQPPVPTHVQAGPPYFATGGALGGEALASFIRWSAASYTAPELPHDSTHAQADSARAAPPDAVPVPPSGRMEPLNAPAPASPARSATPVRSPRSPPHPAFVVREDRAFEVRGPQGGSPHALPAPPGPAPGSGEAPARLPGEPPAHRAPGSADVARGGGGLGPAAAPAEAEAGNAAPAAPAAAYARSRIAAHSLVLGSHYGAGHGPNGGGAAADGARLVSSLRVSSSSSTSSFGPYRGGVAVGPPHLQKPSSNKSVRFSDDGPEDPQLPVAPAAQGMYPRQRAAQPPHGRAWQSPVEQGAGSPSPSARQQPYRPQGAVQHPAMPSYSVGKAAAAGSEADAAEQAPGKRYSAVAAVTAVPRPPVQQ